MNIWRWAPPPADREAPGAGASDLLEGFAVAVTFESGRAVLGVRGEVDILTAPELKAVLEAIIRRGHHSVVLDLTELRFMDASGLGVMAQAVQLLGPVDGSLTVRSPSAIVRRILQATGLSEAVGTEAAPGPVGRSVPEATLPLRPPPTRPSWRTALTERMIRTPSSDEVLDAALRLVVGLAQATVGGADGVSVSLRRRGRLVTVAVSDQTVADMDAAQYATGQGPCVDASVTGARHLAGSLETESRWPVFTPRAQALGIRAILSSPLWEGGRPVGALNLYSRDRGAFAPAAEGLASVLAAETSVMLADRRLDEPGDLWSDRLEQALRSRRVIAQAEGILMERGGLDAAAAYRQLRRSSVAVSRPLIERAEDIVDSTWCPQLDAESPGPGGIGG